MFRNKKLEYTLNTNQGTPDVYVNGVYKGTVSNGVCKWKDSEYKTDVTITLQNCTAGNTYQSSQNADAWISVDGGTPYYDTQFKKITYTEEGSPLVVFMASLLPTVNLLPLNSSINLSPKLILTLPLVWITKSFSLDPKKFMSLPSALADLANSLLILLYGYRYIIFIF